MKASDFTEASPGRLVITPEGVPGFVPNPLPPSIKVDLTTTNALVEARAALGYLSGVGETLPNPHLLIRPFLRKEAEASSRIEGTLTELSELLLFDVDPSQEPEGSDAGEIRNHVIALEKGLESLKKLPVSLRSLRESHATLMSGVRGGDKFPGEFRRVQNWIGRSRIADATYVPPPVTEMQQCLSDWERFIHDEAEFPPLIRLALLHYQFEAIHPFVDGNGRVGRLLIPILMCEWRLISQPLLYLSVYFERNWRAYFDLLLAVSQHGLWNEWMLFFLKGIEQQAKDAAWRSRRLMDKWTGYRSRGQSERSASTLLPVIDGLLEFPYCTARRVETLADVSPPTALKAIGRLESLGIVTEITGNERNRIWRASDVMNILTQDFSESDFE